MNIYCPHWFTVLSLCLSLFLTGCLGGGDGSDEESEDSTTVSVAKIVLLADVTTQLADNQSTITLTAVAKDADNLPLSGINVTFYTNSDTALFSAQRGLTDEQGRFIVELSNSVAENISVYARADGQESDPLALNFIEDALDPRVKTIALTLLNNHQPADGQAQITLNLAARDANGAIIPNVSVSLASSSNTAQFAALSGSTGTNGTFTTTVTNQVAETFTVTPIAGGRRGDPVTITFVLPSDQLTLSATAVTLPVQASTTVMLSLYQGNETNRSPLANAPFTASVSGHAQINNLPAQTNSQGQASFNVSNQQAENVIVTVRSGELQQQLTLYFGAYLQLTPYIAHIKESITLTALLKDAQNRPIVGLPLQFSFINQNNETLSPSSAITDDEGTAEVIVRDLQRDGGEAIVKVTSGQLSDQSSVRFQAVIGEDYQLTVAAEETVLSEGDSTKITAKVTDAQGLPVSNEPIKFYPQAGSGRATIQQFSETTDEQGEAQAEITGSGTPWIGIKAGNSLQTVILYFGAVTQLSPASSEGTADGETPTPLTATVTDRDGRSIAGVAVTLRVIEGQAFLPNAEIITDENGQINFNVLSNDDGKVTLSAQAGSSQPATTQVIFYPVGINPQVDTVSLVVSNSPQPADGVTPITLTVIAQDAEQSPLANIPVSFTSESPNAFFSAVRGVTGENGRFSTTVTNQVVESFNVTAVAGGMRSEPQTLNFTNLTVGSIQLTASENILQPAETATVTATILGAEDTASPLGGTPLQVAVSGQARLRNVPQETDVNGQAQFQVTSSQKENVLVTVSSGSRRQTLTLYFGASLTMTRSEIMASRRTAVSALLKDANNTPIAAETIHFRFIAQNPYTLSASTDTTDNSGYALVEVIDVNQQGGEAVVVAHRGQLKSQANVKFLAGFADNYQLRAEANATVLPVGEAVTMTARIKDDRGNPVVEQPLNFSVIRSDGGITQATVTNPQATTDEQGEAQTQILAKRAENLQAIVQAGDVEQRISLYVGGQLRLTPKETSLTVNNATPTPFTATLSDYLEQPISGAVVKFNVDGRAQWQPSNVLTDENGQAEVNVTNQQVETVTLTAQSGLLPLQTALIHFQPAPPQIGFLSLSSDKNQLSLNDAATITATVYDTHGQPMSGEMVQFQVEGVGTISSSALTDENGTASATFHSRTIAGLTTITASSGEFNEQLTLSVQAGEAGIIELVSIEPQVIGIVGSGVNQTARLEFLVKDNLGNPLEKQLVKFSLGDTTLGGGEALVITEALTNNGTVTTSLKSGAVAGNIDVIATVADSQISTVARVTIVGGMPDADHFSLAVEHLNIAGGVTFGLQNTVTAYVGDRFGNIVPDGTAVSFITEGGTIGKSIGGDAFTTTTEFGQASAILQSAAPSTPDLGGVAFMSPGGYACGEPYNYVSGGSRHLCGNPGLVTIVAYTTGSESFIDSNGNGLYDEGEPFDDLSEPYLNSNENVGFNPGELYIDVNGNGQFDQGDNQFQSNTTIWKSIHVLFSADTAVPTVEPSSFNIPNGGSQTFVVREVGDIYGNALVAGSRLTVTANGGVLGGTTEYSFNDSNGRGIEELTFTLASLPPEETEDEAGNVTLNYPAPQSVTITIQVDSPRTADNAAGGNGTITPVVISGQINTR